MVFILLRYGFMKAYKKMQGFSSLAFFYNVLKHYKVFLLELFPVSIYYIHNLSQIHFHNRHLGEESPLKINIGH